MSRELLKPTVETALSAELTDHLGYDKHGDSRPARGNDRNGSTSKVLKSQNGEVEFQTPRDRDGAFELQMLRKHQTCLTQMDDQILTLYAKGLSTREIVKAFKEVYDAAPPDSWVIREALHNCLPHQNYRMGGKINIVEHPDKLVLTK